MEIPARLVKQLRDRTGAPMMDCKRALVETNGNPEAAERLLREWGTVSASKKAGRKTTEGKVVARTTNGRGTIVAVGSETEPVANNEEFLAFTERLLDAVDREGPEAASRLEDERVNLVARIGENVEIRGASRFDAADGEVVSAYVHPPAAKIGVLVRLAGSPELARMLAMHISFANPRYVTRADVPADEIANERAIYEKLPDVSAKPEHVRPKIIEGMLTKRFFAERVLADQPWIHDDSITVEQALRERGAEVRDFVRYSLVE